MNLQTIAKAVEFELYDVYTEETLCLTGPEKRRVNELVAADTNSRAELKEAQTIAYAEGDDCALDDRWLEKPENRWFLELFD